MATNGCTTVLFWENAARRRPPSLSTAYVAEERALFVRLLHERGRSFVRVAPVAPPAVGIEEAPHATVARAGSWHFEGSAKTRPPHPETPTEVELDDTGTLRFRYGDEPWSSVALPWEALVHLPSALEMATRVLVTPLFFAFDVITFPLWGWFVLPFVFSSKPL